MVLRAEWRDSCTHGVMRLLENIKKSGLRRVSLYAFWKSTNILIHEWRYPAQETIWLMVYNIITVKHKLTRSNLNFSCRIVWSCTVMTKWRNRQSKHLSPIRSWVQSPLQTRDTYVRIRQRSADGCQFTPGTPVCQCWQEDWNCKISEINGTRVITVATTVRAD